MHVYIPGVDRYVYIKRPSIEREKVLEIKHFQHLVVVIIQLVAS